MKVNILFSGLCLFVPKPGINPLRGNMYVLLPDHHHGGEGDRHTAVLMFDPAHLRDDSIGLFNMFAQVLLRDRAFTLGDADAEMRLCPQIVDLRTATGTGVDPLSADTTDRIVSRVSLGTGGMTKVSPGYCWKWEPEGTRPLAHQVLWEMELADGPLTILLQNLRKTEDTELTLYPVGGVINLAVHHVPHGNLPLDPPPDLKVPPPPETQPEHFRAFFHLFPGAPVVLPRYKGPLEECGPQADPCPEIPELGGSPFTCMVGGVTPP